MGPLHPQAKTPSKCPEPRGGRALLSLTHRVHAAVWSVQDPKESMLEYAMHRGCFVQGFYCGLSGAIDEEY